MSGGGGTNTTTTQSGPPQQFLDAYSKVIGQAQNVAATPYQQYPGNLVAPFSPDQNTGMQAIEGAGGIAAPYINSAADYINRATTPIWSGVQQFSPSAISQYQSPYTANVVDATRNLFNEQNAEQLNQVRGNAASAGAFGGDREAVAEAETARQQQLAEAPTLANLENQGYSQALQEFNQQQGAQIGANEANSWLNSQAGFGMGNLGQEALGTTLSGANALLGVGGMQQQQAQQGLNIPYEQFVAQQAYPFQTTGWLGNISEGLGGAAGGSSSTSTPAPSPFSQILGGAAAGAGILGQTGAFGSGGWLGGLFGGGGGGGFPTGLDALSGTGAVGGLGGIGGLGAGFGYRKGGAVVHRAPGGMIPGIGIPDMGMQDLRVPDVSISVVPNNVSAGGGARFPLFGSTGATTTTGGGGGGGGGLGSLLPMAAMALMFMANGGKVTPFPQRRAGMRPANDDWPYEPIARRAAGGMTPASVSIDPGAYAGSPSVPHLVVGGGGMTPSDGSSSGSIADYLNSVASTASHDAPKASATQPSGAAPPPPAGPMTALMGGLPVGTLGSGRQINNPTLGAYQLYDQNNEPLNFFSDSANGTFAPPDPAMWGSVTNANIGGAARGGVIHRADGGDMGDDDTWDMPTSADAPAPSAGPSSGGMRPAASAPHGADPWSTLTYAGLGIMGGTSPNALTNIGRGATQGLELAERQRERQDTADLRRAQLDATVAGRDETQRHNRTGEQMRGLQLAQQATAELARIRQGDARIGIEGGHLAETQRHNQEIEGQGRWIAAYGQDDNGNQVPGMYFAPREGLKPGEKAQFYPGMTTVQHERVDQGQQSLDQRRRALDETIRQHGLQNDRQGQADAERMVRGASDEAIRLYSASKDPITGKFGLTLDQAEQRAAALRDHAAANAPARQPSSTPQQSSPAPSAPGMPRAGDIQQGYRFKGGNPADPGSWEPAQQGAQ